MTPLRTTVENGVFTKNALQPSYINRIQKKKKNGTVEVRWDDAVLFLCKNHDRDIRRVERQKRRKLYADIKCGIETGSNSRDVGGTIECDAFDNRPAFSSVRVSAGDQ